MNHSHLSQEITEPLLVEGTGQGGWAQVGVETSHWTLFVFVVLTRLGCWFQVGADTLVELEVVVER